MKDGVAQKKKLTVSTALMLTLAVFLIGTILTIAVGSNFGKTDVRSVIINDGITGKEISAVLLIPENATAESPAPVVITAHGGSKTLAHMSSFNIELSRRGYVVLAWDANGSGQSDVGVDGIIDSVYQYTQNLSFVNPEQVVVIGQSAGGTSSYTMAQRYDDHIKLVVQLGMNIRSADDMPETNFAYVIGKYDGSALARCPNNTVLDMVDNDAYRTLFGTNETIEPGKLYGSWEDGTARIFLLSNTGHTWEAHDYLSVKHCLYVINCAVANPTPIADTNQIWQWQSFGQSMVFLSILAFLFVAAAALLKLDFFSSLILPARKPIGFKPKTKAWYMALVILIVTPPVFYIICRSVGELWETNLFVMNTTVNGLVHWRWAVAAFYLVMFLAFHFAYGKRNGGNLITYGFATAAEEKKISAGYILRAILLGVCVVGAAYGLYLVYYEFAKVSICVVKWQLNKIPSENWRVFLLYFAVEIPYLVVISLANRSVSMNNGARGAGKGMRNSMLMSVLISTSGLVVALIVFVACIFFRGELLFQANRGYIFFTGLGGTLPFIAICGLINCYITNRTNSIYAGTTAAALLSVWTMVGNFSLRMPL